MNQKQGFAVKPPMFPPPRAGAKPQQYLYLANMFRTAALGLPAYVGPDQNWPVYALLLHSCELGLKAFCDQAVANGKPSARAPNHDLQGWYRIAVQYGLPDDPHIADAIAILADLHASHYTRYPDNRKAPSPGLSNVVDDVVDRVIAAVSPSIVSQ
jgi:hypothetical protein